jgi:hypothetical protein
MSGMSEYAAEDRADQKTAKAIAADKLAEQDEHRKKMLAYIRDVLIDRANMRRSCFALNVQADPVYRRCAEGLNDARQIAALDAAANVFIHLHAEWVKEDTHRGIPSWLRDIARQGMAGFKSSLER